MLVFPAQQKCGPLASLCSCSEIRPHRPKPPTRIPFLGWLAGSLGWLTSAAGMTEVSSTLSPKAPEGRKFPWSWQKPHRALDTPSQCPSVDVK